MNGVVDNNDDWRDIYMDEYQVKVKTKAKAKAIVKFNFNTNIVY